MAIGTIYINTDLVADNDELLLTGDNQAKILFLSYAILLFYFFYLPWQQHKKMDL